MGKPIKSMQCSVLSAGQSFGKGLPDEVKLVPGEFFGVINNLSVNQPADLHVDFLDDTGVVVFRTNPMRIEAAPVSRHFWGDLHGQSEETIGTNTAEAYFSFARDYAFVDATGHQGNDFQIT